MMKQVYTNFKGDGRMGTLAPKITLLGTHNTRELGGYPLKNGQKTRLHSLLRSDSLHDLDAKDCKTLYAYGVRTVVDLRSQAECADAPCALLGWHDIAYHNVPLLDSIHSSGFQGTLPKSMGEMYVDLLDKSQPLIRQALALLAQASGCALFNCTAGKDRTGVIAMLFLLAAGVDEETVIADYAATYQNLERFIAARMAAIKALRADAPEYLFRSDPEQMAAAIAHLNQTYGGIENYLSVIGIHQHELVAVKSRLAET